MNLTLWAQALDTFITSQFFALSLNFRSDEGLIKTQFIAFCIQFGELSSQKPPVTTELSEARVSMISGKETEKV